MSIPDAPNPRMTRRLLSDGRRLYLADGPINLILEADGPGRARDAAFAAATERFASVLDELCAELPQLRRAVAGDDAPRGRVARRMWKAVLPYARTTFITPMAAVAGAVAEEILAAMVDAAALERAYVNNGGDIAIHLGAGRSYEIGLVARPDRPRVVGVASLRAEDASRGIATSGWRGRSFSKGIADAVTVIANTAAAADAAATIIANAVDLPDHPAIRRQRARDLQPDSDLGEQLVTVSVEGLTPEAREQALGRGLNMAETLLREGLIAGASLWLDGTSLATGPRFIACGDASSGKQIAHAA